MFAIIETGGKQYKVEKGMTLDIERIDKEEGATLHIDRVLLFNDGKTTKVGTPVVSGAQAVVKIVAHKRGDKIIVFKMKPKKRYQVTQGHRQELTTIEVTELKASGAKAEEKAEAKTEVKTEKSAPKTVKKAPKKKPTAKTE